MARREKTEIEIAIIDGATRTINAISNAAKTGKTTFTELSSAVGLVENALGKIAAVGNFAVDLLNPAREAETAMQRVAVATGATADELEALRAKANQIAFDLRVPFDQVAAGAEQLAREGANATQVIANIAPVAAFAKTALITTKEAAGQLSDVLDTFGQGIEQIGAVGDAIIATAQGAGTSAQVLTEGLAKIGPAASQAGLSVNQTVAILGALAEKGIEGGRAAKQLETIFLELQNPASKAGEALRGLGLDGSNLGPVFQRLSTDSAAAEAVLSQLSDKPRLAMQSLLADGGGALTKLTGIIENSGGASKEAADKLGSTFDGAVARIGIALDALKASFFAPILAPLAAEIDAVSAKIQAFSQTPDFEILRTAVGDFVTKAVAELNRLVTEFDATKAVAGIRQFVQDAGAALGGLKTTVDTLKDGFALVGIAFNSIQVGAATVVSATASAAASMQDLANKTGLAGDEGERYSEILKGIADSAADSAVANDRERQSYEELLDPAENARVAVSGLAAGQLEAAGETLKNTEANQQVAVTLPQVTELSQGLKDALNQTAEASVRTGSGLVEAVKKPIGPIDTLRAKIATLNEALRKAFAEGANTDQLIAELNAAEKELQALTGAAVPAADAVNALGNDAAQAAPKVASVGTAASEAATQAAQLDASAANASASIKNTGIDAQGAANDLGQVSAEFAKLASGYAQFDQERTDRLKRGLTEEREDISKRIGLINDQIAALDPLEQAVKRLRSQYRFAGEDQIRLLAQLEQKLNEKNKVPGATPGQTGGNGGNVIGGGLQPVFNFSFPSLNPGDLSDATIRDLARKIAAPLKQFYLSGS